MQQTELLTQWGARLAGARQAKGLSIGGLATQAGMHKSHLARFERGEAGIGDGLRIRLAAELGQEVADLFPYPSTATPETSVPKCGDCNGRGAAYPVGDSADTGPDADRTPPPPPPPCPSCEGTGGVGVYGEARQ